MKVKIAQSMVAEGVTDLTAKSREYVMFSSPFVTVLREGLEAVVFVGDVGLSEPASSFSLAVVVGMLCGVLVGYFIYRQYSKQQETDIIRGGTFVKTKYLLLSPAVCYISLLPHCSLEVCGSLRHPSGQELLVVIKVNLVASMGHRTLENLFGKLGISGTNRYGHVKCCGSEDKSNGG